MFLPETTYWGIGEIAASKIIFLCLVENERKYSRNPRKQWYL
jgi:hypothetical protein